MTDQTEPKLQVNDWAWHIDGYLVQIAEVQDDGYGVYLGGHTLYSEFVYFDQIQKTVAIHPIEHHKCKDCEHTTRDERFKDKPWVLKRSCMHLSWLIDNGFYMDEFCNDISDHAIEHLEPPPNCYCFTPKLSPDEKESNGKDM